MNCLTCGTEFERAGKRSIRMYCDACLKVKRNLMNKPSKPSPITPERYIRRIGGKII